MATVKSDIHDIAKNFVAMLLCYHGFAVTDHGKDGSAQTTIDGAQKRMRISSGYRH